MKSTVIRYKYIFEFENQSEKEFLIELDKATLQLIDNRAAGEYPDWALLAYNKCDHCTLTAKQKKYCPVAANLSEIVDFFSDFYSVERVNVTVETENRSYFKKAALQKGISSLMGIYTVTCECPVLSKLRPMVRFHLPFATSEETLYRGISMYLVGQYYRSISGEIPDWELKGLLKIYDDVHLCNQTLYRRISGINNKDAGVNALIILDTFASFINISLDRDRIMKYSYLFR